MTDVAPVEVLTRSKNRTRVAGHRLRSAREAAGLSQQDLAALLQVRIPTISERENSGDPEHPTDEERGRMHTVGVPWETWLAWCFVCKLAPDWQPSKPTTSTKRTRKSKPH